MCPRYPCHCLICGISAGLGAYMESHRHEQEENDRKEKEGRSHFDIVIGGPAYIYDPNVLDDDGLKWTGTLHLLGYNQYATGPNKAFLSGPGTYQGIGRSRIRTDGGSDPNEPEDLREYFVNDCRLDERNQNSVYPLHWSCLDLLTRAICDHNDITELNKDVLFETFTNCDSMTRIAESLDLEPYWQSKNQYWTVKPGFGREFAFCDPARPYDIQLHFQVSTLCQSTANEPLSQVDLRHRIRKDPFALLPIEVVYQLTSYLAHDDLVSCMHASWYFCLYTRHNEFWSRRIRADMPWFWELRDLTYEQHLLHVDYKRLYLWANAVATPKQWMTGEFMNLASRQRIWLACEKLAKAYQVTKSINGLTTLGPEAWLTFNKSQKLYIPKFSNQQVPGHLTDVSTLWLHSWHELSDEGAELIAYWDAGYLTGLELFIKGKSRLHGQSNVGSEMFERHSCTLDAGDWIKGMILHVDAHEDTDQDQPELQIDAVTVLMSSGGTRTLREECLRDRQLCKIPLLLAPRQTLVGVTGRLHHGRIASLGLMQCKHPRMNTAFAWFAADLDSGRELLLHPHTQTGVFKSDLQSTLGRPIWDNTNFQVIRSRNAMNQSIWGLGKVWSNGRLMRDMALWHDVTFGQDKYPQHVLLLASSEDELRKITKLYFYVPPSERSYLNISSKGKGNHFAAQKMETATFSIAGAAVEITDELGTKTKRFVDSGPSNRVPLSKLMWLQEDSAPNWEAEYTHHFEVDGPAGERLTSIEISTQGTHKIVKLNTSFQRTVSFGNTFGNTGSMTWTVISADEKFIAGLVFVFGQTGGYNLMRQKTQFHHRRLSDISVLTLPHADPSKVDVRNNVNQRRAITGTFRFEY